MENRMGWVFPAARIKRAVEDGSLTPLQNRAWAISKWTREFFQMTDLGFLCVSFCFRLLADTTQSLLLQSDLPATCRGHSEAGQI